MTDERCTTEGTARPAAPSVGAPPSRRHARREVDPAAIPASGAWRAGDDPGHRRFVDLGPLPLEAGGRLPQVRLAYETWGELNAAGDNAVLVLHALTGDAHVTAHGPGDDDGWWGQVVGPGRAIDTNKYFVVAPNVLGGCQGSTGPSSPAPDGTPWGSRFPLLTVRDQVAAEIELADRLGVGRWALVVGASMGGHRVLEWAVMAPERVAAIAVVASAAQSSAEQVAWAHTQLSAIRLDAGWRGGDYYDAAPGRGPHAGLGLARQIAHTTYRSPAELDGRFGRLPQHAEEPLSGGRYAVQSYLDHHAGKLALRFDAGSYVTLTQSMVTHDLGRDRGGVEAALAQIQAETLVVAVDSDRLFFPAESERIAAAVPRSGPVAYIRSDHGHDGFLVEHDQVTALIGRFLRNVAPVRVAR
ncbi:homoserine O-acetyltransferase [Georgenia yuyongxinii]|uniref:Homoserine O-acetyltransferase n=1 Tax=Georgenia yuyongxinii TaxID=2589797 RepID=A0A5B8C6G1_9MICO|nr:homoserine O-acetyltransferase [Georgenia yuyongxinii]QDC26014.1 homoserine O-acetyltransferase [Georgenia yuyongxinii]